MARFFLLWILFIPLHTFSQTADELYEQGLTLKKDKKIKEALVKFQEAVKKNPSYDKAQYEIGWCQNDLKDYTSAMAALRSARKSMNDIPKVHFELGYAFEMSVLYDSARASYEKCRALKPDYTNIFKRIATTYYTQDKYEEAIVKYKEHISQRPDDNDYLLWYRKGYCENALKKYNDAIQSLTTSLNFKKDYINTYLEIGFANCKLKQDEAAISYYNKAIELDPKSHIGYNGIGEVYRDNKKDMVKSMEWYQKALAVKPNERKANFGMGYCLNSQEKFSEAAGYLSKAIEQEDTYTAAFVELGYSYYKLGRNAEAEKSLLKAITLNPKNENSRYYLCLMYISQKDKLKAQKMVDELKSLNNKNASSLQEKVNAL